MNQQLFEVASYQDIEQFSLKDNTIQAFISNLLNAIFNAAFTAFNTSVIDIRNSFAGRVNTTETLIFGLLGTFLFLALIEIPLGCYLLRTVHVEEGLFLKLPNHISREHQDVANNFIVTAKVVYIVEG